MIISSSIIVVKIPIFWKVLSAKSTGLIPQVNNHILSGTLCMPVTFNNTWFPRPVLDESLTVGEAQSL